MCIVMPVLDVNLSKCIEIIKKSLHENPLGILWMESIGRRWISLTKTSHTGFNYFFVVRLNKLLNKQPVCQWFEKPCMRRHASLFSGQWTEYSLRTGVLRCVEMHGPLPKCHQGISRPDIDPTDDWHLAYMFSLVYFSVEVCLVGLYPHSVSTWRDPCVRVCVPLTLAPPLRENKFEQGVTQLSNWAKRWGHLDWHMGLPKLLCGYLGCWIVYFPHTIYSLWGVS